MTRRSRGGRVGRAPALLALLAAAALGCHRGGGGHEAAAATAWDGTPQPFGAVCENDGQCRSHACFVGGSQAYCSLACTKDNEATACPKPLTTGVCNKHGFCKKP